MLYSSSSSPSGQERDKITYERLSISVAFLKLHLSIVMISHHFLLYHLVVCLKVFRPVIQEIILDNASLCLGLSVEPSVGQ